MHDSRLRPRRDDAEGNEVGQEECVQLGPGGPVVLAEAQRRMVELGACGTIPRAQREPPNN